MAEDVADARDGHMLLLILSFTKWLHFDWWCSLLSVRCI